MKEWADDRGMDDAPVHYGAEEALAWAAGWNAAVADLRPRQQNGARAMPCERHHDGFDCHQRKCAECFGSEAEVLPIGRGLDVP